MTDFGISNFRDRKLLQQAIKDLVQGNPVPIEPSAEEKDTCVICMDAPKTHMVTPCNHLSYCSDCVKELKHCAICRKRITASQRVYT